MNLNDFTSRTALQRDDYLGGHRGTSMISGTKPESKWTAERVAGYMGQTVKTIADLKAIVVTNLVTGHSVRVLGYYAPGDGGGKRVHYDSTSTATDDGGAYHTPNSGGVGRWLTDFDSILNVRQWGAKGTGLVDDDDTAAVENAINYANGRSLFFPAGNYRVTDTLDLSIWKYRLVGEKSERGCNADSLGGAGFVTTRITFAPVDTTKPLVKRADATANYASVIGPFLHENLFFNVGVANGFVFGDETIDPVVADGYVQKYVFGVGFHHCGLQAAAGVTLASNGRVVRSGRKLVWLTKCFETTFNDVSFYGADTQVRTWGCDKPTLKNIRCQGAAVPFDFNGSGTFSVQHVAESVQFEGWTFGAIVNRGVQLSVDKISLENAAGVGAGVVDLTAVYGHTAAVVAGSASLVFSSDMTDILHAGLSVILLSDGTNSDYCLVKTVAGTAVTIEANHKFTWSLGAANVTRIHGYGVLHNSAFATAVSNSHGGGFLNTPVFLWCVTQGQMLISNASAQAGSYGTIRSRVIGNVLPIYPEISGTQMSFNGCSPLVCADPNHPWVSVTNWKDSQGSEQGYVPSQIRANGADNFEQFSKVKRRWVLTPKTTGTELNSSNLTTIKRIAGDTNSGEMIWAWYIAAGGSHNVADLSMPSVSSGYIRVVVRAKAVGGSASVGVLAVGNTESTIATLTVGTSWAVYDVVVPIPAAWVGARSIIAGLRFGVTTNPIYLAGAYVEDVPQAEQDFAAPATGSSLQLIGMRRQGSLECTKATATTICTLLTSALGSSANLVCGRLRLVATNRGSGEEGYAHEIAEYQFGISTHGGAVYRTAPSLVLKTQGGVNAGVITIDVVPSLVASGSDTLVKVTPAVTGSSAAGQTGVFLHWEIELMGSKPVF